MFSDCRWKNWKRRWFVLNNRCLYYFQHTAENSPKGIIPLENVKVKSSPFWPHGTTSYLYRGTLGII